MNDKWKIMMATAVICVGTCAFANPHGGHMQKHEHNEGLALAAGIVNLVCKVLRPEPVIVAPPPPVQPTVIYQERVIAPPRPIIIEHHRPTPPPPPPKRPHNNRPHR